MKEEASKKDTKLKTEEASEDPGFVFVRLFGSRLKPISSRHEEILGNPDRSDKLVAGKMCSLQSTMKNTVDGREQGLERCCEVPTVIGMD